MQNVHNFQIKKSTAVSGTYKLLTFMAMLYLTADLTSAALCYKFVKIHVVFFSAETLIFPFTYLITDVIAEVYGYSVARKLIWFVLFFDTLFGLLTSLLVQLPSPMPETQHIYNVVFASLLRGSAGEIAGVLAGIFINIYAISKLKILTSGKYFWIRSISSSLVGEAVLVLVAMPIIFLGTTSSLSELWLLMLFSYLYKIIFALIAAYPATLAVRAIKKIEKIDVYDYDINYNPFAVFSKSQPTNLFDAPE
jgi:queuosine precursor transporter